MENKRQFKGFVANNDFFPQDKPTCASSQWFYNKQWIKYVVQVTWVFFSYNLRYHTEWILLLQIFCSKTTQAFQVSQSKKLFVFSNSPDSLLVTNHRPKCLRTLSTRCSFNMPQNQAQVLNVNATDLFTAEFDLGRREWVY